MGNFQKKKNMVRAEKPESKDLNPQLSFLCLWLFMWKMVELWILSCRGLPGKLDEMVSGKRTGVSSTYLSTFMPRWKFKHYASNTACRGTFLQAVFWAVWGPPAPSSCLWLLPGDLSTRWPGQSSQTCRHVTCTGVYIYSQHLPDLLTRAQMAQQRSRSHALEGAWSWGWGRGFAPKHTSATKTSCRETRLKESCHWTLVCPFFLHWPVPPPAQTNNHHTDWPPPPSLERGRWTRRQAVSLQRIGDTSQGQT